MISREVFIKNFYDDFLSKFVVCCSQNLVTKSLFIINFQEDLFDFGDPGKNYHSNRLVVLNVLLFICCGPGAWVEKGVIMLPCFLDLIMILFC